MHQSDSDQQQRRCSVSKTGGGNAHGSPLCRAMVVVYSSFRKSNKVHERIYPSGVVLPCANEASPGFNLAPSASSLNPTQLHYVSANSRGLVRAWQAQARRRVIRRPRSGRPGIVQPSAQISARSIGILSPQTPRISRRSAITSTEDVSSVSGSRCVPGMLLVDPIIESRTVSAT